MMLLLLFAMEVLHKVSAADNGQPILAVQLQPPQEVFPEARSLCNGCCRREAGLLALAQTKGL